METRYERDREAALQWMNRANDLHAAAASVDFGCSKDVASTMVSTYALGDGFDMSAATTRVKWMLLGMAIELAAKAALVARKEQPPQSHDLNALVARAGITVAEDERRVLEILTHAVVWFGRYPVPVGKRKSDVDALGVLATATLTDEIPGSMFRRTNGAMRWPALHSLWLKVRAAYVDARDLELPAEDPAGSASR
jgi:HEPN domain